MGFGMMSDGTDGESWKVEQLGSPLSQASNGGKGRRAMPMFVFRSMIRHYGFVGSKRRIDTKARQEKIFARYLGTGSRR